MRLGRMLLGLCLVTLPVGGSCGSSSKEVKTERKSKSKKARKVREKTPEPADDADSAYRKAIDAEADEKPREANKYYQLAIRRDDAHRQANQRYVHFLIDHGKKEKALKVARRFHDNLPGQSISYHTLADAHAANGEHAKVVGVMSGLIAFEEKDASAYEIRGRARMAMGDQEKGSSDNQEEGIADIRRAVELEPDNPDFLNALAGGLMRIEQWQEARKVLGRALRSDKRSSRAHLLLGLLSRKEGKKETEALKHFKRAVGIDPELARAHFELGISQNRLGNDVEAEKRFGKAIDLDPKNGTYWYIYGDLLRLHKRTEEAAAAYRKSVKSAPKNVRAWERLGETLLATKQFSDAEKQIKRGIRSIDEPRLYFLLGKAYQGSKNRKRAVEALENYLDAAPNNAPDRRAAKKLLKQLRR